MSDTTLHDAFRALEVAKTSHVARRPPSPPSAVLLATARVRVADRFGAFHHARALIDQGSEASLVSESLAQRLKLPRAPTSITVFGVGGKESGWARGLLNLSVSPRTGGSAVAVSALILPQITLYDGGVRADRRPWKHLAGLELADPEFSESDPVDLLLGAEVYASILRPGLRRGGPRDPVAQQTMLGWILSGAVGDYPASVGQRTSAHLCHADDGLADSVQRFWLQEEVSTVTPPLTPAERECEEFFARTHTRNASGRYIVRLPVVPPLPDLSTTRDTAIRVFSHVEKKFARDEGLRQLYVDFMRQYERLGHMTATEASSSSLEPTCFLSHHGVMREASSSTKLRVVFNGSANIGNASLNKHLMVGPNLLPALDDILMRWRTHRYVLAADIEKIYRQILVDPEDRDMQRIIWRYERSDELREYRLLRFVLCSFSGDAHSPPARARRGSAIPHGSGGAAPRHVYG